MIVGRCRYETRVTKGPGHKDLIDTTTKICTQFVKRHVCNQIERNNDCPMRVVVSTRLSTIPLDIFPITFVSNLQDYHPNIGVKKKHLDLSPEIGGITPLVTNIFQRIPVVPNHDAKQRCSRENMRDGKKDSWSFGAKSYEIVFCILYRLQENS